MGQNSAPNRILPKITLSKRENKITGLELAKWRPQFRYNGPDWLLMLLANANKDSILFILLLLWLAWHLRNNLVHDDTKSSIDASSVFVQNYIDTLNCSGYVLCSVKEKLRRWLVLEIQWRCLSRWWTQE
jgi:hypothetical protein